MNLSVVNVLLKFSIIFIFITIISMIVFNLYNKKKSNNYKLFGLFMNLKDTDIFILSSVIVKELFIISIVFIKNELTYYHLFIVLLLSFMFVIYSKKIQYLIINTIGSVGVLFCVYCSKILSNYMIDVKPIWYVALINVLLCVFIVLFALYDAVRCLDFISNNNEYLRSKKNGLY